MGRPVAHDATSEQEAALRACVRMRRTPMCSASRRRLRQRLMGGGDVAGRHRYQQWRPTPTPTSGVRCAASERNMRVAHPLVGRGMVAGFHVAGRCVERRIVRRRATRARARLRARRPATPTRGPSKSRRVSTRFHTSGRTRALTETAEVDCNDDAPGAGRNHSRIERVLEPGKYFVFVDGYAQEGGSFKMTITASDVLALLDVCRRAPLLSVGGVVNDTTSGREDDAQASCGDGAQGADMLLGIPSCPRGRAFASWSTRTRSTPSCTYAAPAPMKRANRPAAIPERSLATPW